MYFTGERVITELFCLIFFQICTMLHFAYVTGIIHTCSFSVNSHSINLHSAVVGVYNSTFGLHSFVRKTCNNGGELLCIWML